MSLVSEIQQTLTEAILDSVPEGIPVRKTEVPNGLTCPDLSTLDLSKPDDLNQIARHVELLRADLLFESKTTGLGPLAEQHFCLAVGLLDQVYHHLRIAGIHQDAGRR
jgi:hypothetical protein